MKINVLAVDKQIITLDVDQNDLVRNVKSLLKIERHKALYNGKEMSDDDKLSELGVHEGDSIVLVSDSGPISSSSTTEMGLNPDGSAMNLAGFQQEIRNNSYLLAQLVQNDPEFAQAIAEDDHYRLEALLRQRHQQREEFRQRDGELQGITSFEDVPKNDEGEVCLAFLAKKEISSHLLDEEKYPEQEPVEGNNKVDKEVKVQTNGGSTHAEENDHALNSSDKELSTTSIQKVGSSDHNESDHFASREPLNADMLANNSKGTEVRSSELIDSSLFPSMASPSSPNPPQTKGHGLKKWRRIRREFTKDPSPNLDSTKVLKRGSATILDVMKPNDDSVSSTNAFVKSPGHTDLFSNHAPSSNYQVAFSAGTDDSEDRSSKSSTAASVPKYKYDVPKAAGYHQREKHRLKNVSGRQLNSSGQRLPPPLGKGHAQAEASKKPRGENIDVDKENSLSSMESDSRSYTSLFVRGTSINSDQVQSGRSANYDEEDSYDQQASEVQSSKELQAGHSKNDDISPDCSAELSCSANIENSKDHQVSRDCEPLLNSIFLLQSAQEALEREVKMFKEIGKGVYSLCDDSGKTTGLSAYSTFVGPEVYLDRSYRLDAEFNHAQTLERQLDEAQLRLKEKDLKVLELEKMMKSMNMESPEVQGNLLQEMEAQLEGVFKLKVEAEVHYVVMTGSRKDLGVFMEDQINFLRDRTRKLIADVENKGSILEGQAKLNNLYTDITEDEAQKMQRPCGKFLLYVILQFVLLVLVIKLFLLPVLPKSATVVPT